MTAATTATVKIALFFRNMATDKSLGTGEVLLLPAPSSASRADPAVEYNKSALRRSSGFTRARGDPAPVGSPLSTGAMKHPMRIVPEVVNLRHLNFQATQPG